jgi:hypothetical protein
LLPVFLVFWERAINRRHRRRLKYSGQGHPEGHGVG